METLKKNKCDVCGIRAFYNYYDKNFGIKCSKHRELNMINVNMKKCIGCNKKVPFYNYKNESTALYCSTCKEPDMINIKSKRCIKCKLKYPIYNRKEENIPLYCNNIINMSVCISFDENGDKCTSTSLTNSKHCDIHVKKCHKLHKEYKKVCKNATKIGECFIKDIKYLDIDEILERIKLFNLARSKHKQCYEKRLHFSQICVHESCRDAGHEYKIQEEKRMSNVCENLMEILVKHLNSLREKVAREQEILIKKQHELNEKEKKIEEGLKISDKEIEESIKDMNQESQLTSKDVLKKKKINLSKILNKSKNLNEYYKEREIYKKLKAYNYFFTKLYIDPKCKFESFDNLDDKQLDDITTSNGIYLQGLSCKKVLLQIQLLIMNVFKRLVQNIRDRIIRDLEKNSDYINLDNNEKMALVDNNAFELIGKVKTKLLKEGKFENYNNLVINYDSNNFNCLLTIKLDNRCDENFIYYFIYFCDFIFKSIIGGHILHYSKMSIFNKLKDENTNVMYTIAKLNDILDDSEKFV